MQRGNQAAPNPPSGYRRAAGGKGRSCTSIFARLLRAEARLGLELCYWRPLDCGPEDELIVSCAWNGERLTARLAELPSAGGMAIQMRARMYAKGILGAALEEVEQAGINLGGRVRRDSGR